MIIGKWPPVTIKLLEGREEEKLIERNRAEIKVWAKKSFLMHLCLIKGDQSTKSNGENGSQSVDCKDFKRAI